jgi:hypothetical protein
MLHGRFRIHNLFSIYKGKIIFICCIFLHVCSFPVLVGRDSVVGITSRTRAGRSGVRIRTGLRGFPLVYHRLAPRLITSGVIPVLPLCVCWCGRGQFTLYLFRVF